MEELREREREMIPEDDEIGDFVLICKSCKIPNQRFWSVPGRVKWMNMLTRMGF